MTKLKDYEINTVLESLPREINQYTLPILNQRITSYMPYTHTSVFSCETCKAAFYYSYRTIRIRLEFE